MDNSLKKRETTGRGGLTPPPAKGKTKTFLIGKELKTKTCSKPQRNGGNGTTTKPKTLDSLRQGVSQAAAAAPTLAVLDAPDNRLSEFIAERNRTRKNPMSISILEKTFFRGANASFRADSQNVALLAAGVARGELQVARVILRIQPNPQQPHSATADFDLVRMEMANEVGRERWTLSLQFQFLQHIPPELIVFNPMGIVITYLQGDRATVTGDQ